MNNVDGGHGDDPFGARRFDSVGGLGGAEMTDENGQWWLTRRRALVGGAAAAGGFTGLTEALGTEQGDLYGGMMALSQSYKIGEKWWQGPDSAKTNITPEAGRRYSAVDTVLEYYGDGSGWVALPSPPTGYQATDRLPLITEKFAAASFTTTSTTYTSVVSGNQKINFPTNAMPDGASFEVGWAGVVKNDTGGETTSARLRVGGTSHTETEVTHTGTGYTKFDSPLVAVDLGTDGMFVEIEAKVTGGTGTVEGNTTATLYLVL